VGDNAYKLQLLGDMAVLATFNAGDFRPYVKDKFEDRSDLRANSLKEGATNVEHDTLVGSHNPNQIECTFLANEVQGNHALVTQIQGLFSFSNPELSMVLDNIFLGVTPTLLDSSGCLILHGQSFFP